MTIRTGTVLVEFMDRRPFAFWWRDDEGRQHQYDIAYCRRDKCLMAWCSGGDGTPYLEHYDNRYWLAPGVQAETYTPKGKARQLPPENRMARLNARYKQPVGQWASEDTHFYFCPACTDWLPSDEPCEHGESE